MGEVYASQTAATFNPINPFVLSPHVSSSFIFETQKTSFVENAQSESHVKYTAKKRKTISKQLKGDECANSKQESDQKCNLGLSPECAKIEPKIAVVGPFLSGNIDGPAHAREGLDSGSFALAIEKLLDIADRIPFVGVKNTNSKVIFSWLLITFDVDKFKLTTRPSRCGTPSPVWSSLSNPARSCCRELCGFRSSSSRPSSIPDGRCRTAARGKDVSGHALKATEHSACALWSSWIK